MIGKNFGKLTVINRNGSDKRYEKLWLCKCECGKETTVPTNALKRGNTKSCGCLALDPRPFEYAKDYEEKTRERIKSYSIIDGSCWRWQKTQDSTGYGMLGYRGKLMKAHRVSWIVYKGDIPLGIHVLHKCDNPWCVNPEHLWLGTQSDNMQDMHNKHRHTKGKK